MVKRIKQYVEWNAFGVCSAMGRHLGLPVIRIRQYFIYTSLLTVGSPIIIYLILAFLRNLKHFVFAKKRNPWYYS